VNSSPPLPPPPPPSSSSIRSVQLQLYTTQAESSAAATYSVIQYASGVPMRNTHWQSTMYTSYTAEVFLVSCPPRVSRGIIYFGSAAGAETLCWHGSMSQPSGFRLHVTVCVCVSVATSWTTLAGLCYLVVARDNPAVSQPGGRCLTKRGCVSTCDCSV